MIDLAILLSIALAVTAALGLLLAGFVWTPWLVGLALVMLLVALLWLTRSTGLAPSIEGADAAESPLPQPPTTSESPVLHYRGAECRPSSSSTSVVTQPDTPDASKSSRSSVLHYRGAECRPTPDAVPPAAASMSYRGVKYRGTQSSADATDLSQPQDASNLETKGR